MRRRRHKAYRLSWQRLGNYRGRRKKRANETVAASRECFDVDGLFGGIGERLAEFVDGFVEAVFEVDESFLRPKAPLNLFPGDYMAGALEEHDEDFERLSGKADLGRAFSQLAGRGVHEERAETEQIIRLQIAWHGLGSGTRSGDCISRAKGFPNTKKSVSGSKKRLLSNYSLASDLFTAFCEGRPKE